MNKDCFDTDYNGKMICICVNCLYRGICSYRMRYPCDEKVNNIMLECPSRVEIIEK